MNPAIKIKELLNADELSTFRLITLKSNFYRLFFACLALFIVNAVLLVTDYLHYNSGRWLENPYYIGIFIGHLYGTIVFGLLSLVFRRKSFAFWQRKKVLKGLLYTFLFAVLVYVVIFIFSDLHINGQITVFLIGVLGISAVILLSNKEVIAYLTIMYLALVILLIQVLGVNTDIAISHLINGFSITLIAFFTSRAIYRLHREDFKNKQLIKRQNHQLHLKNEDLENFVQLASHDMKSPLNLISMFCELSSNKIDAGQLDDARDHLGIAKDNAKQLSSLIDGILKLSGLGSEGLNKQSVDLNDVMEQVKNNIILDKGEGVRIAFTKLPTIQGDAILLVQLFQNIISNGLKYNDSNHPEIVVQTKKGTYSTIRIRDNGLGMSAEEIPKIFQLFSRLDRTQTYDGSGIGLAICKKIADLHKARIEVLSELGVGSEFVIQFGQNET